MSKGNVKPAKRYRPTPVNQDEEDSSNNNNNNQNNSSVEERLPEPKSKDLVISPKLQGILDTIKKARAANSDYMQLEPDFVYRLFFDPEKTKIEKKTFSGVTKDRVAYNVTSLDEDEADRVPKTLSLTLKQSKPIEEIIQKGWTVMDITKTGEGMNITYKADPIE